jgi:hypothetical protein
MNQQISLTMPDKKGQTKSTLQRPIIQDCQELMKKLKRRTTGRVSGQP